MKSLNTLLIASSFLAGSVFAAAAQTNTKPAANTGSSAITAATHCKDAKGQARLKDAAGGSRSTTGATGGGMVGGPAAGSPNTNAGPAGGLSTTAQLPNC